MVIIGKLIAKNVAYEWKIDDFASLREEVGKSFRSPLINEKWYLVLCPNGQNKVNKGHLSIYLHNTAGDDVTATVDISLLNGSNEITKTLRMYNYFFEKGGGWGNEEAFKRKYVLDPENGLLVNGALTILCEIYGKRDALKIVELKDRSPVLSCYEKLLNSGQFSDVTFILNEKKIPAHKMILSTRSTVFASMFAHDMKENAANEVQIKDIDYDVFIELLRYLYSGNVENIEKYAADLLVAADKYLISLLKSKCARSMGDNLNKDVALNYFVLADTHNVEELKDKALQFIKEHPRDIVNSSQFKEFNALHPNLGTELMRNLIN